ncbi:hypothetical protein FRC06_008923 [Ceratobasidium sp. 370]|nr:hypothetical protein FRC06_008923 [Ceratobasidium sp. 370]
MYEDHQLKSAPSGPAPPVPALDPRYRPTSSRPGSMSVGSRASMEGGGARTSADGSGYEATLRQRERAGPFVSYGGSPGAGAASRSATSSRSYGQLDGPNRPSITLEGRPSMTDGRPSMSQEPTSSSYHTGPTSQDSHSLHPARRSSLQHPADSTGTGLGATGTSATRPNRTPSPRIAIQPNTASASPALSTHSNPSADLLTPATDKSRERRTSSKRSTQTTHTQATTQTEYTTRGSTEDADGYRVRATYARLEVEGVPGDGWMEGVERTRTRIVSAASAAVLEANKGVGGKGADVSEDEERQLRSTDRYGFFSTPAPRHEDRLALLPAQAFRQPASTSKQPPIPAAPSAIPPLPQISTIPPPSYDPREAYRIAKWERMLLPSSTPGSGGRGSIGGGGLGWKWDPRKVKKRTERVFKGVPDRWRSAAWGTLVEERVVRPGGRRTERVGLGELARRYRDLLDLPSEHDVQIDLDVPRTISGHVMFHTRYGQGQRSLFHVLHAFSLLCPSCGYVQGMGPIAATLLNYFEPERTYAILVRLHDEYEMHTIFQPGFPGLLESIYVQERLVERIMPGVYQALSKHMISSTSFVTKWYITLFTNTVPFQTQLRLWDAFLLEGRDVLIIAAVAILWVLKDQLSAGQANFETILSLLSSTFVLEDEDEFLRWMERLLTDQRVRDEMDGWRADWGRLVAEGKSGNALL